jgi:hypothetical protein
MDLEKVEKELKGNRELNALARSPEGKALAAGLDETALQKAVRQGDSAALQDILRRVLSTPEGKALAEKVRKAVGET